MMELLVAYKDDPAGTNMAESLSQNMKSRDGVFHGDAYDLAVIPTPAISADWLEEKFDYDGFVFLSKHAAESGTLALTCHSTGNFSDAKFGGSGRKIAIPHPSLQKTYLQELYSNRQQFPDFQITIEATHHGPTDLGKPSMFVEVGTTPKQWNDAALCSSVASILDQALRKEPAHHPVAVCFGGTHYPAKFTKEVLSGMYALGTVVPKHALPDVDESLFSHIMRQNKAAEYALLDWNGLGAQKQKIAGYLSTMDLEVIKV